MEKKLPIVALAAALLMAIIGIGYFIVKSDEPEQEAALQDEKENLKKPVPQEELKAETPDPIVYEEHKAPNNEEQQRKVMKADETKVAAPQQPASKDDAMKPQLHAEHERMLKEQVPRMYDDLFKELALPDEQRQKVENHLVKAMKSESEIDFKLLDPTVPVEEVLKEQEKLARELQGDLNGVLSQQEQDVVKKHQDDLPKKMQKQQIMALVESLNLPGGEKENVRTAVETAVQNLESKKRVGQYSAQDIAEIRKQFGGAKPGDPEFMRATIEISSNQIKSLLKDLEHLPRDQYDALKTQIEMPLEMMRQNLRQQGPPPGKRQ